MNCCHCGADVWWSFPRSTDPCFECGQPVQNVKEPGYQSFRGPGRAPANPSVENGKGGANPTR